MMLELREGVVAIFGVIQAGFTVSDLGHQQVRFVFEGTRYVRDESYFALLRNYWRYGWILLYLFGASPAVCKSFLCGQPSTRLEVYNENSYYGPYATSLRMGDIGYQNSKELGTGVKANYDGLEDYLASLV